MQSSSLIAFGAVTYVVILILISVFASRRIRSSTDFIVAGRQLPLSLCVFTVFATWFGSGTLIGAAGAAYTGGLRAVVANPFGSALCLLLAAIFYARVLRRLKLMTLPDLFRTRYGRSAEVTSSICIIPAYVGWVGSIFVAFGTVLNVVAGIDFTTAIIIGAVITIGYTFWGGMWAVSLTDFFQAVVIILGLLILFPLVLGDLGGWQVLVDRAPANHFRMTPEPTLFGWIMFTQALLVIGLGNIASQDLLQRVFSARDEKVAQWSLYLSSALYLTIAMIPVLIGIAGAIVLPDLAQPEFVLPEMGKIYLPPLGMALFAGAMFSALMSSADGGMLAPASIIAQNIMKRPASGAGAGEDSTLRWTRLSVVVVGVLGLATALFFQDVYQLMVKSFSLLMVGLFVPMTAAIYWKKANQTGAVASSVSGLASWLVLEFVNRARDAAALPSELMGAGIGLVVLVVVSLATGKIDPAKSTIDIDGNPVVMKDRLGVLPFPRVMGREKEQR